MGDPPAPDTRRAGIEAVRGAIEARMRRARRRKAFAALGAIAAGLIGVAGVHALRSPAHPPLAAAASSLTVIAHPEGSAEVRLADAPSTILADGRTIPEGARLSTGRDGAVTLAFSTGTRLVVEADAELAMIDEGRAERFSLAAGSVRADVAKLGAGERFVLATPDAEVEVHGTSFRVSVVPPDPACGHGSQTRLIVFDGVVSVRAGDESERIAAGGTWPKGCETKPNVPVAAPAVAQIASTSTSSTSSKPKHAAPAHEIAAAMPDAPERASTLGAQNDLFAQANAEKQRGHLREAVAIYDRLIGQYPTSPLLESALAERMTLLGTTDPARARDAAERYLAAYPRGFARDEAEALRRGK